MKKLNSVVLVAMSAICMNGCSNASEASLIPKQFPESNIFGGTKKHSKFTFGKKSHKKNARKG
jgi:PBP1b-binding outer membrane lipoprotein LpoB